ncbi:MAG: type IV secretory system conjugative DNA transfer family protein [Solirubrobacteraceae bacterium]|jgi:type IV secretion system protein VirD4
MSRPEHRGGGDVAVLVVALVFAIPVAIALLTTAAASLLATGHPIALSVGDALGVLVRLPGTLAHPALAWPARIHRELPGSFALQVELVAATLLVLGAAALLLGVVARHLQRRDRGRAARWASRDELVDLHARRPQAGRITLGEHQGKLVAAEPRVSVLGVGPAQSGKSTGLIVPAILEWQGPVLSTSIKADVVHDTQAARSRVGEVFIFDPTASTGLQHTAWSPIAAAHTWEGSRRTAANLLGVGDHSAGRSADETFWKPASARFLAPLLLAAAHGQLTMADVLSWIAALEEDQPTELLKDSASPGALAGLEALRSVWKADPRFRSNLTQTIATSLDAWHEPAIAAATAGESQISAQRLLAGTNTLYLVAPAHEQRRLRGLFTALVADIAAGAFERSAQTGRPIDPPLLLALDEAANIAPLPNLDEIASSGPGQGVQLLTILQNISQATDRWGKDRAETIIANHRARVFCSGIGDRATLDYVRQTLGDEEIDRISTHRQSPLATGSRTYSSEFRAIAAPHRVRQADTNTALLIYGRLQPAWVNLRPWYANRELRQLVSGDALHADGRPAATAARRVILAVTCAARRQPGSR